MKYNHGRCLVEYDRSVVNNMDRSTYTGSAGFHPEILDLVKNEESPQSDKWQRTSMTKCFYHQSTGDECLTVCIEQSLWLVGDFRCIFFHLSLWGSLGQWNYCVLWFRSSFSIQSDELWTQSVLKINWKVSRIIYGGNVIIPSGTLFHEDGSWHGGNVLIHSGILFHEDGLWHGGNIQFPEEHYSMSIVLGMAVAS